MSDERFKDYTEQYMSPVEKYVNRNPLRALVIINFVLLFLPIFAGWIAWG